MNHATLLPRVIVVRSQNVCFSSSCLLVFTPSSHLRRTFVRRESNFAQLNNNNVQHQATTRHMSKIYDDFPAKCSSYLRHTFVVPSSYLRHTSSYPTHSPPRSGGGRLFRTPKSKMAKHYNIPENIRVGGMSCAVGKGKGIGKPTPQQSISVYSGAELAL